MLFVVNAMCVGDILTQVASASSAMVLTPERERLIWIMQLGGCVISTKLVS